MHGNHKIPVYQCIRFRIRDVCLKYSCLRRKVYNVVDRVLDLISVRSLSPIEDVTNLQTNMNFIKGSRTSIAARQGTSDAAVMICGGLAAFDALSEGVVGRSLQVPLLVFKFSCQRV